MTTVSCTPLSWFFGDTKRLRRDSHRQLVHWRDLYKYGWTECSVDAADYGDIPSVPGVYVIVSEIDDVPLYVGESINLSNRLRRPLHRKLKELVRLYESAVAGYHDIANPIAEMQIVYKEVQQAPHSLSIKQSLIWHEAVTIALLGPIAQHSTAKLWEMNIQLGRGFYSRDKGYF